VILYLLENLAAHFLITCGGKKMKKYPILFFMFLLIFPLLAQEETLVSGHFHSGGYGGPVWKVGLINGKLGMFSGGRGGWIINHALVIGGGGYSTLFDIETDAISNNYRPLYLEIYYGGCELEYIHNSDKLVHWTIHALFGSGSAKLRERGPDKTMETDGFFLMEPSFNIDLNVTSWFRLGAGVSYRLALGLDMGEISSSDLGGPSGQIIFKFGSF
jgi:hypothetical protein